MQQNKVIDIPVMIFTNIQFSLWCSHQGFLRAPFNCLGAYQHSINVNVVIVQVKVFFSLFCVIVFSYDLLAPWAVNCAGALLFMPKRCLSHGLSVVHCTIQDSTEQYKWILLHYTSCFIALANQNQQEVLSAGNGTFIFTFLLLFTHFLLMLFRL